MGDCTLPECAQYGLVQDLHLGVEAFGDAVIPGEASHAGDLLAPGMQGIAERHQGSEHATPEHDDVAQKARGQVGGDVA